MIDSNQIIGFIQWYQRTNGATPSIFKIADHFNVSKNAIYKRINTLCKENRLQKFNGKICFIK